MDGGPATALFHRAAGTVTGGPGDFALEGTAPTISAEDSR